MRIDDVLKRHEDYIQRLLARTAEGLQSLTEILTGDAISVGGTATITAAATTVTVTHGAGITPTIDQIFVTPNNNTTVGVGLIWVDTITSTTFKINVAVAPGVSTLVLGWRVFK